METIFQEIERALEARLYFAAIALALAVPDICGALESTDGQTSGAKYKAWYNANLAGRYNSVTDIDMYSLRCGLLHQGRYGHPRMNYARIVFTLPVSRGNVYHNNKIDDALNLDVGRFCRDVIECGRTWALAKQNDPVVQINLPNLVQYRPDGLAGYILGTPVIA